MEKVSRVESLQEIIAEMSDGEENPATTRSQPLLLPTHAATEIHSLKIEQDYPKRATSKENVAA